MSHLKVKRQYIAITGLSVNNPSQWSLSDYSETVWELDTRMPPADIYHPVIPVEYTTGILTAYIDGDRVDLGRFDAELVGTGWTRKKIEEAIR